MSEHLTEKPDQYSDPMEAIYALNIGDFVAESFFSDDLLDKINQRMAGDPERLKAQLEELVRIYSLDQSLGVLGFQPDEGFVIYDSVCQTLCQMLHVDRCHLWQAANAQTGDQANLSLTGTSVVLKEGQRWEVGIPTKSMNLLSDCYQLDEAQVIKDVSKNPVWKPIASLQQADTKSVLATPLREGAKRLGLVVFESDTPVEFTKETIGLSEAVSRLFVTGMRLQELVATARTNVETDTPDLSKMQNLRAQITESIADLGEQQQQFLEALSDAVDARNDFSVGHSRHVGQVARSISDALKLNEKTTDLIYYSGLLGSLGKFSVDPSILAKKGKLTPEEWDELKEHPNVGVSLLAKIHVLSEITPYVQYSYERWNGTGSPEKLKAKSIPLGSRILAVADAYNALTTKRPYRETPLSHTDALKTLQDEAGEKWDPLIVDTLSTISADDLA